MIRAGKQQERHFFPMPNDIFRLDLSAGAIAVYAYLMCCEDHKTYRCYPSYTTIGQTVGLSKNTVRKYVRMLEQKGLIETSPTTVVTKKGEVHNGSLKYHIRPIAEAEEGFDRRQMKRLQEEAARVVMLNACFFARIRFVVLSKRSAHDLYFTRNRVDLFAFE